MSRAEKIILLCIIAAFTYVFILAAWVGDDVYITLRTVDNLVNGHGLRWNVTERVQSYTHPLWLLVMIPIYFVSRNPYFTALFVSCTFSFATLALILRNVPLKTAWPGLTVLLVSRAFVDFSVSGLENPATHFFLVLFIFLFLDSENRFPPSHLLTLGLVASLSILNRQDAALFYIPALLYIFYRERSLKTVSLLVLSATPILFWELFSLFYYGFPFPNTYYAKVHTGIATFDLARQTFVYYLDSFQRDPITLTVIFTGLGLIFWKGNVKERLLGLGVVFYLLYLFTVGGDFMSGRFFSAALLVTVLLATRLLANIQMRWKLALATLALVLGMLAPYPVLLPRGQQPAFTDNDLKTGINDERAYYYKITGLPTVIGNGWRLPNNDGWVEHGIQLRENDKSVVQENNIGFVGFYAGPTVHLLDVYALGDPLLARLPIPNPQKWRIGHFERAVPAGYVQTLRTGENKISDPQLAAYYEHLNLIISAPLLSVERLQAIWNMNTGQYDFLLKASQRYHEQ